MDCKTPRSARKLRYCKKSKLNVILKMKPLSAKIMVGAEGESWFEMLEDVNSLNGLLVCTVPTSFCALPIGLVAKEGQQSLSIYPLLLTDHIHCI